jgi:hypothetical protein
MNLMWVAKHCSILFSSVLQQPERFCACNDGGASVIVGDRGVGTPKGGGREGSWSPGKVLGFSCILDTFYDNLKGTDLVYFIS